MGSYTIAEKIVKRLMEEGELFELDDQGIDDACNKAGGTFEFTYRRWRWSFTDGSSMSGGADGWWLESEDEPFVIRG